MRLKNRTDATQNVVGKWIEGLRLMACSLLFSEITFRIVEEPRFALSQFSRSIKYAVKAALDDIPRHRYRTHLKIAGWRKRAWLLRQRQLGYSFKVFRNRHWRPRIRVFGADSLSNHLRSGGAVLWTGECSFSDLIMKLGLSQTVSRPCHISWRGHGRTVTPLESSYLKEIKLEAENLFLDQRISIKESEPGLALLEARRQLKAGKLVTLSFGAHQGRKTEPVNLFGSDYHTSVGAPFLAYISGRPLFLSFTFQAREEGFDIFIYGPVGERCRNSWDEFRVNALRQMQRAHEILIPPYRDQWLGWHSIDADKIDLSLFATNH